MALQKMKNFFSDLAGFLQELVKDERIPSRDKKVLVALVALILSPIDLIPDWIPIIGVMDDIVMMAIVLDYFFEVLDEEIILSHYPWGMKSYTMIKRTSKTIASLTPEFIKRNLWKYEADPYRKQIK